MSKDYYDILGVSRTATEDEIKKAFRKISKENHPDMQVGKSDAEKKAAEARFKEASEAYDTLSSKEKREKYDMMGSGGQSSGFGDFRDQDDVFSHFASHFGGFGGMPGFGHDPFGTHTREAPDPNGPEDGADVQIMLDVTFKESLFGVVKEFDINVEDICHTCNGTGTADGKGFAKCPHCNGTGMMH